VCSNCTIEGEVSTDPTADNKASIKSTKLATGVTVEGKVNTKPDEDFKGTVFGGEAQYSRGNFSGSLEFRTDHHTHKVKATAAVGFDGVSLGGAAVFNLSKGAELADYNLGVEFQRPNYSVSLTTEKQLDWVNLYYQQKLDSTHTLGAQFKLELGGKRSHVLTVGNEYALSPSSTLKSKVDLPSGQVSFALDHRLKDPSVSVSFVGAFTPSTFSKQVKADKWGFGLSVGDY